MHDPVAGAPNLFRRFVSGYLNSGPSNLTHGAARR